MQVDEIVESIVKISGRYNPYTVFSDWVKMYAISIQNACVSIHGDIWKQREKIYNETMRKYSKEEIKEFCRMSGLLIRIYERA